MAPRMLRLALLAALALPACTIEHTRQLGDECLQTRECAEPLRCEVTTEGVSRCVAPVRIGPFPDASAPPPDAAPDVTAAPPDAPTPPPDAPAPMDVAREAAPADVPDERRPDAAPDVTVAPPDVPAPPPDARPDAPEAAVDVPDDGAPRDAAAD